jgi:hypothetical protein
MKSLMPSAAATHASSSTVKAANGVQSSPKSTPRLCVVGIRRGGINVTASTVTTLALSHLTNWPGGQGRGSQGSGFATRIVRICNAHKTSIDGACSAIHSYIGLIIISKLPV